MDEMREIAASRMNNRSVAFDWAELAFCENPNDDDLRKTLEDTAKLSNKFEQLVSIYKEHLTEFHGDTRFEIMK